MDIYGSATQFLETVLENAKRLGVSDIVIYHGEKNQNAIAEAIRKCHVGVVPNRRSVFTDINFPTRLFEYLSMHRPVVAPATQGIMDYFRSDQLVMFEPNNVTDLANKILWVKQQPQAAETMVANGIQVYRDNLWSGEKARFFEYLTALVK